MANITLGNFTTELVMQAVTPENIYTSIAIFFLGIFLSLLLEKIVRKLLAKLMKSMSLKEHRKPITLIRTPLVFLFVVLALRGALLFLPFTEGMSGILNLLTYGLIVILISILVAMVSVYILMMMSLPLTEMFHFKLTDEMFNRIYHVLSMIVFLLGIRLAFAITIASPFLFLPVDQQFSTVIYGGLDLLSVVLGAYLVASISVSFFVWLIKTAMGKLHVRLTDTMLSRIRTALALAFVFFTIRVSTSVIPFIDTSIISLVGLISDLLLIALVTYLLAGASELFITRFVGKQIERANPKAAAAIIKKIRESVILLFVVLGARFAFPLFSLDSAIYRLFDIATYIASVALLSYTLILSVDSILSNLLENLTKKTKTPIERATFRKIRRSVLLIIVLIVIRVGILALDLAPSVYGIVDMITYLSTVIIIAYIIASLSEAGIIYFLVAFGGKDTKEIKRILPPLAFKTLSLTIYLVALFNILTYFNIEIGPLMAGMGVAGIAVALASQTIFADMFSGMVLSVDKPFKIGDRILLEDGRYGEVTDIGNRTTKLKTIYSTVLTLPNSVISSQIITNLSAPDYRLRVEIPIGVSYDSDIPKVKKVLEKVAAECGSLLKEPKPTVLFIGFEDYYLDLRFLVWSTANIHPQVVKDEVCTKILEAFRKNKITIPFPIRTLDMPEKKKRRR